MRRILFFGPTLFAFIVMGCGKKDDVISDPMAPSRSLEIRNVAYGNGSRQLADVYLPANRNTTKTKAIVMIHGGSWIAGDKNDLSNILPLLRNAMPEAAFININYTLADGTDANKHPAQMKDIKTLLQFLDARSGEWNISGSRSILGISAGGHLGMLYTYAYDTTKQIKFIASIVGPTNLTDPFYTGNPVFQNLLATYMGKTYAQDPVLYQQMSPAINMTINTPPTYMAYGGADPLVPLSNPTLLENKLKELKVPYKYDFYLQESHEFSNVAINSTILSLSQFWRQQLP